MNAILPDAKLMSMFVCVLTCGADFTSNVLFQPTAEVIEKTLLSIPPSRLDSIQPAFTAFN